MMQNTFKARLGAGPCQFGLWTTLSTSFATEVVAGAGFDWLCLDTEHSPADPLTVLPQLQCLAGYPSVSAIVRPAANDAVLIKRFLDLGAQTLLIPMVNTVEDARAAVAATRYAPQGIRGASALTRATQFGRIKGYFDAASTQICTIAQIETKAALEAIEDISAVEGIEALFIGPADLAASLGYGANQQNDELRAVVLDSMSRIKAAGKPVGLLTGDPILQNAAVEQGCDFLGLGVDVGILARGAEALRKTFSTK